MKTRALAVLIATLPGPLSAETTNHVGTVNFANGALGLNAPVTMKSTGEPLQGPFWEAELWIEQLDGPAMKLASAPLETGEFKGYFFAGRIDVPQLLAEDQATLSLRIIHTQAGEAGRRPITLTLGGGKLPPANLPLIAPFEVSAPLRISLNDPEGQTALVSWPQDAGPMILETTTSLPASQWQEVETPWSINGDLFSVEVEITETARFFRLRSELQ